MSDTFCPHWILLFRHPHGRAWVFWVLSVIMIGDTLAYFVGRRFGGRKLAPEISPGKNGRRRMWVRGRGM